MWATGQVVTKTMTGSSADGWNLIGNPYPAPIRWAGNSTGGWSLTNIHSQAWAWMFYNGLWVAIDPDSDIAIGQAFWFRLLRPRLVPAPSILQRRKQNQQHDRAHTIAKKEDETGLTLKLQSNGSATETAFIVQRDSASSLYSLQVWFFQDGTWHWNHAHDFLVKDGYNLGFYGYNHEMENDIPIRIVAGWRNLWIEFWLGQWNWFFRIPIVGCGYWWSIAFHAWLKIFFSLW